MSWTWGVWYLQISSPRRSQSFTRGSRQILAWNCVPAMLPSCQIWFEVTVSLKAIFSYSMKQFFRKFSSHSSSCWDSYWVTNVWWHLRNRWFSRRAVRWRYLCLEIFLSSSNLCCSPNKKQVSSYLGAALLITFCHKNGRTALRRHTRSLQPSPPGKWILKRRLDWQGAGYKPH